LSPDEFAEVERLTNRDDANDDGFREVAPFV
jgi:hypothetical protein